MIRSSSTMRIFAFFGLLIMPLTTLSFTGLPSLFLHSINKPMRRILDIILVSRRLKSSAAWNSLGPSRITSVLTRIRWFHLPISFAVTFVALEQFRKYRLQRLNVQNEHIPSDEQLYVYRPSHLEVSIYRMLPLRMMSRLWGWINSIDLPPSMRSPILRSYATAFGCNLDEANTADFREYKNLGEFFRRSLKPGVRPIHGDDDAVVSPSDGTILHMGLAKEGLLEQVKGITYPIESFLGPITWKKDRQLKVPDYQKSLLHHYRADCEDNPTDLYYCVIYLAPGDYHRFHSPVNWTVKYRRYFPGKLYSVRPTFVSWFPNVFSVNERVAYIGTWKHGFFAMAPVGATNVGSMRIYFDDQLKTNRTQMGLRTFYEDKSVADVKMKKGDPFGEFNLGSTIVLLFEAPKDTKFNIHKGMKIKYGELISLLA